MDEAFSTASALGGAADSGDDALIVALEGFEGPLDLLLSMARNQKVDLLKISVLKLADQYLAFIESVRRTRLELAADYLVMAAWLTYLKSRLLLPQAPRRWRRNCVGVWRGCRRCGNRPRGCLRAIC